MGVDSRGLRKDVRRQLGRKADIKEKGTKMDVIFGENFWGSRRKSGKRSQFGKKLTVEKHFSYDGRECWIPAVYLCPEGLVADLCVKIPTEEAERFFRVWNWERRESELTDEDIERMEQENPFHLDIHLQGAANGETLRNNASCSVGWYPLRLQDEEKPAAVGVEEDLLSEYGCDRDCGWKFIRTSLAFPENFQKELSVLSLTLSQDPGICQGPHFVTRLGDECRRVTFRHPFTGQNHVLTVHELKQETLSEEMLSSLHQSRIRAAAFPAHYLAMTYTLEPKLRPGELFLRDCVRSDEPVMKKNGGAAAVAVIAGADHDASVIGGADGPTAIFLAGKTGRKPDGPGFTGVCSSLHFEPVCEAEWRIIFSVEDRKPYTVEIAL